MAAGKGLGLILELPSNSATAAAAIVLATAATTSFKLTWSPSEVRLLAREVEFYVPPQLGSLKDASWKYQWQTKGKQGRAKYHPRPLTSILCPKTILFNAFKSLLLPFGLLLDDYFVQVQQAEVLADLENRDEVEWPPFPHERLRPALYASCYNFVKESTVLLVRLMTQNWVWRNCRVEVANKLLKDYRTSAVRKAYTLRWYELPPRLAMTAGRAMAISYGAECVVTICFDTANYLRHDWQRNRKDKAKRIGIILYHNMFRCSLSLLLASVGAGLGGLVVYSHPDKGAALFGMLSDIASQLVIVPYLLSH